MEVWPPRSHTLKFKFLYVTDSTLKPIVGIVVTTSPICVRGLARWVARVGMRVCVGVGVTGVDVDKVGRRNRGGIVGQD